MLDGCVACTKLWTSRMYGRTRFRLHAIEITHRRTQVDRAECVLASPAQEKMPRRLLTRKIPVIEHPRYSGHLNTVNIEIVQIL